MAILEPRSKQLEAGQHHPRRQRDAQHRAPGRIADRKCHPHPSQDADHGSRRQTAYRRPHLVILPAQEGAEHHQHHDRRHQGYEHGLEVGRANRDLAKVQGIEEQRIQCAKQHRSRHHRQQHIVAQQGGITRHQPERTATGQLGRTPGIQQQGNANDDHQQGQDEHAPGRISGECMHTGDHPRAHQEGPQQRQ
ncbi:hypothetical protein SDC9_150714 [bioreactor metagenome]|uniref:Uncharacterized protein n=1 Tax=bioreactor metagenome TaxID=1076179 RepID=A0A645ESK0_9ZZZZ